MTDRFYITTPIYYVNAEPHLGHLYATMLADTVCRFNRQRGRETYFLTGTDEHSQKIERAADAKGIPVQAFVDGLAGRFRGVFDHWKIGYDQFILVTRAFDKDLPARIAEIALAVKFADIPRGFGAYPVYSSDEIAVGNCMRRLFEFP